MTITALTKELISQCPFPVVLIVEEKKQEEYLTDYEKLRKRCGFNAMLSTFMLYLVEQAIEEGKVSAPSSEETPKIRNVGYKNTSEIITRFVENGWMDYYLADFNVLAEQHLTLRLGKTVMISQRDGEKISPEPDMILIRNPQKGLVEYVEALHEENIGRSVYVPPDKIREVFAEIDKRYT